MFVKNFKKIYKFCQVSKNIEQQYTRQQLNNLYEQGQQEIDWTSIQNDYLNNGCQDTLCLLLKFDKAAGNLEIMKKMKETLKGAPTERTLTHINYFLKRSKKNGQEIPELEEQTIKITEDLFNKSANLSQLYRYSLLLYPLRSYETVERINQKILESIREQKPIKQLANCLSIVADYTEKYISKEVDRAPQKIIRQLAKLLEQSNIDDEEKTKHWLSLESTVLGLFSSIYDIKCPTQQHFTGHFSRALDKLHQKLSKEGTQSLFQMSEDFLCRVMASGLPIKPDRFEKMLKICHLGGKKLRYTK